MAVSRPTLVQIGQINTEFGLGLKTSELEICLAQMAPTFEAYDRVDDLADPPPALQHQHRPVIRPAPEQNRFNAWFVQTKIVGTPGGPLSGKTVAVKDNVAVAGVPMINGSTVLQGYVPDTDATVVTRLLEAGAVIAGKAHCEYYCVSGGSHTGAMGPVINPRKQGHSAGGSSSGSAALLAAGEVDLAIGADQGGSIRIPGAYCGVVGMKPTWGLVPYTGVMPIELTLDHVGPMSRTITDNALMLQILAGPDGLDPRQVVQAVPRSYTQDIDRGIHGMRIAVVREGFGWPNSDTDVDEGVRSACDVLRALGAIVEEVSIPMHLLGQAIWTPIVNEGATQQMMKDNGYGFNWKGRYQPDLIDAHSKWRMQAEDLSPTLKMTMLVGEHMIRTGGGRHYAKAQNLARRLRAAYDSVLDHYDVLLMPTVPMKATPLPPQGAPLELIFQRAWEMLANTSPFDVTGHPALQVPCAVRDRLPIGMMLVGNHFDEHILYRAGRAFESAADWSKR